jgi:hypothetical protein
MTWTLDKAVRFVLNQHDGGIKMVDLMEELVSMKVDGLVDDCCAANVVTVIDDSEDMDYLIYDTNRYFVYLVA